jgi:hypothetical protein
MFIKYKLEKKENTTKRRGGVLTSAHENSNSAVNQNTLFHGESLFVVSAGDSERVTLELLSQYLSINIRAHASVVEVATTHN